MAPSHKSSRTREFRRTGSVQVVPKENGRRPRWAGLVGTTPRQNCFCCDLVAAVAATFLAQPGSVCLQFRLQSENCDEFANRGGGLVERGLFFRGKLNFDDLLDAASAEFYRHADEQPVDSVLAFGVGSARKDFFFVFQNRLDHLYNCCGRRVIRRAGLEQIDNFGAASSGALDDLLEFFLRQQLREGNSSDRGIAGERHHIVTMAAQNKRVHVFDRYAKLHRHECAHPRGIQDASHADNAVARKSANLEGSLCHGVQRVCDDDENGAGGELDDRIHDAFHNVIVGFQKIVAAHPGFAREARSDDDNVAVRGFAVVTAGGGNSDGARIGAENRGGFGHIEGFAGRRAVENVRQHHVGELSIVNPLGRCGTDEASAHYRHFLAHYDVSLYPIYVTDQRC